MLEAPSVIVAPRIQSLGAFSVERTLPSRHRRSVGPFVFLDRFGPTSIAPGAAADVRPHPHIGLATLTYLLDGEFVHRDSLGTTQSILPGAVNWMSAGRGITHSERMPNEVKVNGGPLNGLQMWVGLPKSHEESAPSFAHHASSALPSFAVGNAKVRLVVGRTHGYESPVSVFAPTTFAHVKLPAGGEFVWETGNEEFGILPVSGSIRVNDVDASALIVFDADRRIRIEALSDAQVVIVGGEPLDGPRLMWWNFVSSSKDRLEAAREAWEKQQFPKIPGDDVEFIPQPEGPLPNLR